MVYFLYKHTLLSTSYNASYPFDNFAGDCIGVVITFRINQKLLD